MKTVKLGIIAMLMAACGTVVGSRYVKSEHVMASTGSTIAVTATDSAALAGTSLAIPAGALPADTTITVEPALLSLVTDGEALSPAVEWGPSGLTFSTPATMTLPLTLSLTDLASDLEVVVEEADGTVKAISTVTLDATRTLASFKVSGFSTFQVRRRHHACTSNSQCPTAQTCVSGTCRTTQTDGGASGACVSNADCGSTEQCTNGACVLRCALATEVCGDGLDNNCNGVVDEGCPVDGGMMTCASDANCASGESCVNGVCELMDGGRVCRADTDCASGEACLNSVCVLTDGGIDGGPAACFFDTDCASGQSCLNGVCEFTDGGIDAGPVDGGIVDGGLDGGVTDGGLSDGGLDAGPAPCRIDADCPMNQTCITGVCG